MKVTYKQQMEGYLAYRPPLLITELYIYRSGSRYYVCPRCNTTLEREFSAYCDRCGQSLDWSGYRRVKQLWIQEKRG